MKSVLLICPFESIYPPTNGGMQRCFNIIHQLSIYFRLTLITTQSKKDYAGAINDYPAIAGINIYSTQDILPKADFFAKLPNKLQLALRYRWYKKSIKGPADSRFLQYYPVLVSLLKKHQYDAVILENLPTLNAVSIIRKYDPSVKIIYDAHNVDGNLADVEVNKRAMIRKQADAIKQAESTLYKTVSAVFACSTKDLVDFERMNENKLPGVVIPNGVNPGNFFDNGVKEEEPAYILFCGTLFSPHNVDGLLWFYNNIWPAIRISFAGLKLLVLGSGKPPGSLQQLMNDQSLIFTGTVDDVKPWYNKAAVAIVPLLTGSGTRLKILEAMSYGLPVISTSKGAEGIDYKHGLDILIADVEEDFSNGIIALLRDKNKRISLQQNARWLVEKKYDWNIIGVKMKNYINSILPGEHDRKPGTKLKNMQRTC